MVLLHDKSTHAGRNKQTVSPPPELIVKSQKGGAFVLQRIIRIIQDLKRLNDGGICRHEKSGRVETPSDIGIPNPDYTDLQARWWLRQVFTTTQQNDFVRDVFSFCVIRLS